RKATAVILQKNLNRERFPLGAKVLESLQCKFDELFDQARARPGDVFPKIFRVVAKEAESGDAAARALLTAGAQDLRDQAREVIEKLKLREADFFLAKTGGVFDGSPFLNCQFDSLMREIAPKARIGLLPRSVAEAAAQLAGEVLEEIARRKALLKSYRVNRALAFHPRTPRLVSLRLLRDLYLMDLVQVAILPGVSAELKRNAEEQLIARLPQLPLGQKITL